MLDESLTRFQPFGDVVGCSYAYWYLGTVGVAQGEYAQAAARFEQSLVLARQAGDTWAIASALLNAAELSLELREFERAITLLKESLGHFRALRAAWGICLNLFMMAVVAAECGQSVRAARLLGAKQAMTREQVIAYALEAPTPA